MSEADVWKVVRAQLDLMGVTASVPAEYKQRPAVEKSVRECVAGRNTVEVAGEEIVEELVPLLTFDAPRPPRRRAGAKPAEYRPTPQESERARAIQGFFCLQISQSPFVQSFWSQIHKLTGRRRLETPQEAWHFLTSPLSTLFGFRQALEWGVNPVCDEAEIIAEEIVFKRARHLKRSLITGEVPRDAATGKPTYEFHERNDVFLAATVRLNNGDLKSVEHNMEERAVLTGDTGSQGESCVNIGAVESALIPSRGLFRYASEEENHQEFRPPHDRRVQGFVGTMAYQALEISQRLSSDYSLSFTDAISFLLLGTLPTLPLLSQYGKMIPMYDRDHENNIGATQGSWGIQVAPWLSAEHLKRFFADSQKFYGASARPVRNLELFRFVNRRLADAAEQTSRTRPKWDELFCEWKRVRKPEDALPKDYRAFRQTYMTCLQALVPLRIDYRR